MNNQIYQPFYNIINQVSEALTKKDIEINRWKHRAKALATKYKACLYCQSNQDYLREPMACKTCHEMIKRKEVKHE